jgi:DNA-binding MarR family transcriptional regulator
MVREMGKELSEAAVDAWIALMRAQQTALLKIERAFREAELPPLAWYDLLWELDRAGAEGLRPFELEERILIAQSNISRLIDRLTERGYVVRERSEEDGRGQRVRITATGRELRRRMWPIYAQALREAVGSRLTEREALMVATQLAKLADKR